MLKCHLLKWWGLTLLLSLSTPLSIRATFFVLFSKFWYADKPSPEHLTFLNFTTLALEGFFFPIYVPPPEKNPLRYNTLYILYIYNIIIAARNKRALSDFWDFGVDYSIYHYRIYLLTGKSKKHMHKNIVLSLINNDQSTYF